jgi:hypothetical protein
MEIEKLIAGRLKHIISLFVNKEYNELSAYLESGVDVNDFLLWLKDYCTAPDITDVEIFVTMPPDEVFDNLALIEVTKPVKANREFVGIFDLWVDGEKSDLSLEYKIEYYDNNNWHIRLHDLHVM